MNYTSGDEERLVREKLMDYVYQLEEKMSTKQSTVQEIDISDLEVS